MCVLGLFLLNVHSFSIEQLDENTILAALLESDIEDLSSDDEGNDVTFQLPISDTQCSDDESEEEPQNENQEELPATSATGRREIWRRIPFNAELEELTSPPVEESETVESPIYYFQKYFNDDFFEIVTEYTIRYCMRTKGKALRATMGAIKNFFGIIIAMGCIRYPRLRMYWENKTRLPIVADAMSRDRFFLLRMSLHVVDSNEIPDEEKKKNVFWKIQPLLHVVRSACRAIPRTNASNYSKDEQMIPFTGRCPVRQSLPNKPRGVGLKNEVLTTSEGLVLDFEIYQGKTTPLPDVALGLGPGFVLRLIETLPEGSKVFFDRYFTTIPLIQTLLKRNIHGTGTIMRNRIKGVNFSNEKKMKRGDMEEFCHSEQNIVVVQWKDSKSVLLASSAFGCSPVSNVTRWEKKEKKFIEVPCPLIVREYNKSMGGVDICDQLMEAYRSFFKTRKWTLKVFIHFIDLVCCNSWLQYRNLCRKNYSKRANTHDLLSFRLWLAEQLISVEKIRSEEYKSDVVDEIDQGPSKKYRPSAQPCNDKRLDKFNLWPIEHDLSSARCCRRTGCKGRTRTFCSKCNVYLCLNKKQNCFFTYHNEQ